MRRALPLLILLLALAPAPAQARDRYDRRSAEKALERVEELLDRVGPREGRALTPALIDLARQRSELDAADRRRARTLLARPPDAEDEIGGWSAPIGEQAVSCEGHFCFHWVTNENDEDAPDLEDSDDANNRPDYVDLVAASFEQAYATEVGDLQWQAPVSDGDAFTDVYISEIDRVYGYAIPEGPLTDRSTYGFTVVDNDYNAIDFPGYGGDPTIPVQATAAHEFNHVLQYGYDADQDLWMFESTATWAEDRVFNDANDYVGYLRKWAQSPGAAIASNDSKMYGSAIWNHWIDRLYGPVVVRDAWAKSVANSISSNHGFAPGAYDKAIRDEGGPGFHALLADFIAATAEWDAADSGVHEGITFPEEVARGATLTPNGPAVSGKVDHTAFALHGVPVPAGAANLNLTGGLPPGTRGAIALIGFDGGSQTRVVGTLDTDGQVTASLSDPGRFDRITAAVINTDTSVGGVDGADWAWRKQAQDYTLAANTAAGPTVTPTPTPTVTPPPPPPPPPATSVRLSRNTTRIASAARKGVLSLFARTNKAGRLTARATVDAVTAKRLKVGRRTTTAGTGRRTATAPARVKINVKLTRKVRAALRRQTTRTLRIKVQVTFVPSDGTRAVRRTLSILLRP